MREGSPPPTCYLAYITCHMSRVMCHMSRFPFLTCHPFFLSRKAIQWKVCYQRGRPRLVLLGVSKKIVVVM